MKTKRVIWAGIGVLAVVGAALWMRELGLARPRWVGTKIYYPTQMRVSRDGNWLWTRDSENSEETFALEPPAPRPASMSGTSGRLPAEGRAFHAAQGMDTFPRYWFDQSKKATYFVRREGAKAVELRGVIAEFNGALGWSLARDEIYSASGSEISTWNMRNGHLRRRVQLVSVYADAAKVFSPDGQWLLAVATAGDRSGFRLSRFDVQSGKAMRVPDLGKFSLRDRMPQFSPDGEFFLVAGNGDGEHVTVFDATTWKRLWNTTPALSARFSPDGRVGIVQVDGFEWRDVQTGRLLHTQPNPAKGTAMWTISPDGNWVYATNEKKQILKWRAR